MTKAIVVLDGEVAELYEKIKISSTGLQKEKCDQGALEWLFRLKLVRVQPGERGRPDRVKLAKDIDTVDVRIQ